MLFHFSNGRTNAPQCHVLRTVPVLLRSNYLEVKSLRMTWTECIECPTICSYHGRFIALKACIRRKISLRAAVYRDLLKRTLFCTRGIFETYCLLFGWEKADRHKHSCKDAWRHLWQWCVSVIGHGISLINTRKRVFFIVCTFRTFFISLEWEAQVKLFSVCCKIKRNEHQEFWGRNKVTPRLSEALHATGPKQSP